MYMGGGGYYGVKADIQRRLRINKHTATSSKKNTVAHINRIKGNMHTMSYVLLSPANSVSVNDNVRASFVNCK